MGGDAAAGRVGGAGAAASPSAVLVVAAAVGLDALGDEGGRGADEGGGLGAVGGLLAVGAGALDLVAEAGDEAVDHGGGEDGQQDDGEAGDDGGEGVGAVARGERSGEAEDDDDDRLDHDHRDHDAGPAADVAPHVLVDETGVDDDAEEGADVEQGGADDELQPQDAGRDDRDERDDDQHDRSAADVGALLEGLGERPEEDVGLAAGGGGDDLGDAVGGGDDRVEDQRREGRGEDGEPEEADGLGDRGGEGDAADGALGHGEEPEDEREDGGGREDDGVLLEELGVGEVDIGRGVDGLAELADDPGCGVGAALGQGGEGVGGVVDVGRSTRAAAGVLPVLAVVPGQPDDEIAGVFAPAGRRRRGRRGSRNGSRRHDDQRGGDEACGAGQ